MLMEPASTSAHSAPTSSTCCSLRIASLTSPSPCKQTCPVPPHCHLLLSCKDSDGVPPSPSLPSVPTAGAPPAPQRARLGLSPCPRPGPGAAPVPPRGFPSANSSKLHSNFLMAVQTLLHLSASCWGGRGTWLVILAFGAFYGLPTALCLPSLSPCLTCVTTLSSPRFLVLCPCARTQTLTCALCSGSCLSINGQLSPHVLMVSLGTTRRGLLMPLRLEFAHMCSRGT